MNKQQAWHMPKTPWYERLAQVFSTFLPWTGHYRTMAARRSRTGVMFILPFILGFVIFMVRPMIESFIMSFCDVTLVPGAGYIKEFNGIANYIYAFRTDAKYSQMLVEEIGRMLTNTLATLVISFVVAVILNQEFKGRTLARAIFFLPVILSSGVLPGIESQNEFYNMMQGLSDEIANSSGINISAALQDLFQVSGVASQFFDVLFQMIDSIYDIVMASGIQIIVFLGGLQSVPRSLYEAADVEGCTAWESFWKITFPMVSPLLLVNCIYTIIDFFMKNDNKVIEYINDFMYGANINFGYYGAMSWSYFAVAVLFIGLSSLIISLGVYYYE